MPTPTQPVSGATIASAWGAAVHQYTFTPAGCILYGTAVTMLAAEAYREVPIDEIESDPGGWASGGDECVVPTNGAGIYLIAANLISDGGATTGKTSIVLWRNGSEIGRAQEDNEGSLDVSLTIIAVETLEDGDEIRLRGRNLGTGTLPVVYLRQLTLVRIGNEIGI